MKVIKNEFGDVLFTVQCPIHFTTEYFEDCQPTVEFSLTETQYRTLMEAINKYEKSKDRKLGEN